MREILFKAKRIDNGEWVEGSYVYTFNKDKKCPVVGVMTENYWIVEKSGNMVLIDKSTLCQYTDLADKNGNKIWENDVVKSEKGNVFKAFWEKYYYQFSWMCVKSDSLPIGAKWNLWSLSKSANLEVIGNIFDNPELLERN